MTTVVAFPRIIQGGMGVAVSDWKLARAVSIAGQLGVISGTALDTVLVRRLQDGDFGGHMRRAMMHFPIAGVADEVLKRYFQPGGRGADQPYKLIPMYKQRVSVARQQLTMLANFVEIYLAKEGHTGPVGINLLAKVEELPTSRLSGAGNRYAKSGAGPVFIGQEPLSPTSCRPHCRTFAHPTDSN